VERTDWLDAGFNPAQARFLMTTAITHHRFGSRLWGEDEVAKLHAELREIEVAVLQEVEATRPVPTRPLPYYPLVVRRVEEPSVEEY
jgi:hypothetical protein